MTEIRDRADDAVSLFDWSRCVCVSSLIILVGGAKYKFLSCDFDIRDDPATPRQRDREAGCDVCGERYVESGRRGREGGREEGVCQISRSQSIEEVGRQRPERGMQAADLAEGARGIARVGGWGWEV